jgi:hypothetical protein
MPIDQQFVDVDFRQEVPPGEGLGCMHETASMMAARTPDVQRYADNRIIPQSEWQELASELDEELRSGVRNVHNQGNEGSCVGNACVACLEYRAFMSMGEPNFVKLSAMSAYKQFPSATGPNSGSYVSDAPTLTRNIGVLPVTGEDYPHTHPNTGWRNPLPSGYKETAKLFRADWERVDSREAIFSAAFQFKPTIIGRRGHSIMYFLPRRSGNTWYIGYLNSWGNWGDSINDDWQYGLGWDTWNNMARTGYCCENVTIRKEVGLP